ncbi:MAG: TetR/AcrR family transcriptional regulator [Betaproteobacteria bacterium]|nr:TetR/AcrR family transcriptional regulator [Betaproteobacteria bacterium]MBI3806317.1 TetR/AcrR family transcriptional regulator [Nitrospirota bacterium]
MHNKTEDRRPKKTRLALSQALISLMFEKRYESIVIQEILDRANVGRSTFYMHFRDKDELLIEGTQGLAEFLRSAQAASAAPAGMRHEKVIGYSLAMFEHAYEHRQLYWALVGGPGWIIFRQRLEDILMEIMKEDARAIFRKKNPSDVPFELFIYYLASTFISTMTWWHNRRNSIPPKEINELFRGMVLPTLAAHLN